jgi:uncharacterized protein YndB with AHSA1/START domain
LFESSLHAATATAMTPPAAKIAISFNIGRQFPGNPDANVLRHIRRVVASPTTPEEHRMNVVDTAKEQVRHLVEKVTEKVGEAATADSRIQAITIARPRQDVIRLFKDAEMLAEVFGDFAEVHSAGAGRLRWTFLFDGGGPAWDCVIDVDGDTRLRYVDVNPERTAELVLEFRDAPQDRGTEVIARVSSPAPGAFTGALAFKGLYRARAVLQTGEAPTIKHNPSARASRR